ncbi:A/G-specific adenine glycosylase [Stomatohabitans albus]|uniref:A/G-specific adenine glycosylase n=1 Tax=Stomatohabitans albus TaxID=3110766 RepID=UPI00300DAB84
MPTAAPALDNSQIVSLLLNWFDPKKRPLAFRERNGLSPWAILLSEVMAQQTQADRAAQKWSEFLECWPTPHEMAAAPRADIIAAWSGLGYNRRAVNLHRCAEAVVIEYDGNLPDSTAALEGLPGIGPYTARAVMAFAFNAPTMPVDTNIARVISRLLNRVLDRKEAQALADELVTQTGAPSATLTDAIMDLGATICTAKAANCGVCPLAQPCAYRAQVELNPFEAQDPAAKGAHRPMKQAAFNGSDRQVRGAIIRSLTTLSPMSEGELTQLHGDKTPQLLTALAKDGLIVSLDNNLWALP